jgi:hypothetical protein
MIVDSVPTSLRFIQGLDWTLFSTQSCRCVKTFIRGYDNKGLTCYYTFWCVVMNRDFVSINSGDGRTQYSFKSDHEGYGWIRGLLYQNPSVRRFLRDWDHHEHVVIPYESHTYRMDTMSFHT